MANSVTISWGKDELVSYISNLSAYVAQTLSLSGEVAFDINTLTEDNEQTFLNVKLTEAVNALIPYFSRIIEDNTEVQSGETYGITFTPRIDGGDYSKAELSHIKTLCRKIVAGYVLADWYSVKGVTAMNTYFATQSSQSATELVVVLDRFVRPIRKTSVNIGRVTYTNKSTANYKHINDRSDFALVWGTENGAPLPNGEYDIDFYTDGDVVYSVNSLDTKVVKPIEGVNDKVRIIFDFADGHYFSYGVLKYVMRGDILDADFPDATRHFELSGETAIEIWDGPSDGEDVYSATYIPSYIKLNLSDLTDEEINVLQQPALEAAEVANEAAKRANKAADGLDFNGYYPQMSVGFADNISGDGGATAEMFSYRPTAGENRNTINGGAARIEKLKGSSVVVNQKVKGVNTRTQYGYKTSSNGTTITITNVSAKTPDYGNMADFVDFTIKSGHRYLAITDSTLDLFVNSLVGFIFRANTISDIAPDLNYDAVWLRTETNIPLLVGESESFDFKIIDLTLMFGAGNEPLTVAEFYQRMPVGADLDVYNEGTIVDGHYGAIKTTGFNQWDEQWEQGAFDYYTGAKIADNTRIRSLNLIPVFPNTKYYYKMPTAWQVCYFNAEGDHISSSQNATSLAETTPANCHYIAFNVGYSDEPIQSYNNDICINISWDTEYGYMNGMYAPYKPFERDLSWVAKYFPNGMRSAGNVADEIRFNGTTQKWEAVKRVEVRAYQGGDESNATVTTDGIYTNYALTTPAVTPITENVNFDYDISDYGTEELLADGMSAPLSADIIYEPNALASIKNVSALLTRMAQIEAQLATMSINTNEN